MSLCYKSHNWKQLQLQMYQYAERRVHDAETKMLKGGSLQHTQHKESC